MAILALLLLFGCGKGPTDIEGRWTVESVVLPGGAQIPSKDFAVLGIDVPMYEFGADGTGTITAEGSEAQAFTYEVQAGRVLLYMETGGEAVQAAEEKGLLAIPTGDGGTLYLARSAGGTRK